MPDLPRAVSLDQEFYAHHSAQLDRIAAAMEEQNELLRQTLNARTADQPSTTADTDGPQPVELREPDPAVTGDKKPTRTARGGRRATKGSI